MNLKNTYKELSKVGFMIVKGLREELVAQKHNAYVRWTEGNNLQRTDFAGITARKYKNKVAIELAPAIGKDVVAMIRKEIKQNYKRPKTI